MKYAIIQPRISRTETESEPCMTGFAERTRPQGACSKTAGDERRRTIQCTPTTPDTHPPRSISTRSPAFTPSQQSNGIFAYAARPPAASLHAHARCSSRSPLARPLPCVDRTIGERNLTTPRGLLAQLVELTTHCSDCATAHTFCSSRSPLARSLPCDDRIACCDDSGSFKLLPLPLSSLISPHRT